MGGVQRRGETALLTEKSFAPQWVCGNDLDLNVSTTQISTGIYVCLLRKRCVSVDLESPRFLVAE